MLASLLDKFEKGEQLHKGGQNQRKAGISKYNKFLDDDPNLKRWYTNLIKGSAYTAEIYLRRLCSFCLKRGIAPDQFRRLSKKQIEDAAQDYVNELEAIVRPCGTHYAPQYVKSNLKSIKSWAEWNEKKITRRIRIANESETPTLKDEVSPTREELSKLLYAPTTNARTRASIALIAFTGCRPEVQGNKNGTEGLRIGDIPGLKMSDDGKHVEFTQIPAQIVVRSALSKTREQYFTFLPDEGCEILRQYLEERIVSGERLVLDSLVIASDERGRKKISRSLYNIDDKSAFLATGTISKHIRKAMRAVGLTQRPYVLRSYFDTRLMHAEGMQLVTHSYAQFWMGHKGDIERTYTLNKHKLPPDVMQGVRDAAKRVQKVVQTRIPEEDIVTVEEAKAIGKETWFLSLGFTKEEIQKLDLIHKEGADLRNSIRQKLQGILSENGRRQKLIKPEEIDSAIQEGYEYVDKLPDGRLIMRLPEF